MALWTVSWQAGSGGERVASVLADRAGVPLVDSDSVSASVRRTIERDGCHTGAIWRWLASLGTAAGPMFGPAPGSGEDGKNPPSIRELWEAAILEAARSPCVVSDRSAFSLLAGRPNACHVRIRAPLSWRVRRYALEHCLSRECAARELLRQERRHQVHILRRYHRRLDSAANYTVICDASRCQLDELVEMLILAGEPTKPPRVTSVAAVPRSSLR